MTTNGEVVHVAAAATAQVPAFEREDVIRVLMTGDLSKLSDEQRLWYYGKECARMGLDPAARPLEWVEMQGPGGKRLVLYAKRIAGDMLALRWGVSTDLVDGPRTIDIGSTKLVYVKVRATMPNGRHMEDVGTCTTADAANSPMKAVTRGTRRVTLRIAGWSGPTEDDLADIEHYAPTQAVVEARGEVALHPELQDLTEKLTLASGHANSIEGVIGLYEDVRRAVDDPRVHGEAHRMCRDFIEAQGWRKKSEFQKAAAAIEARLAAERAAAHAKATGAPVPAAPPPQPVAVQAPPVEAPRHPDPPSPAPSAAPVEPPKRPYEPPTMTKIDPNDPKLPPDVASAARSLLASAPQAGPAPAPVPAQSGPDPMAAFKDDLITCETGRQCVRVWRMHRAAIKPLGKEASVKAWRMLVEQAADVGVEGADAWLKDELKKPEEAAPPPPPPAAPEPPADADAPLPPDDEDDAPAGDAWEPPADDAPTPELPGVTHPPAAPYDKAAMLAAITTMRTKTNGPQHVADHYAAHVTAMEPGARDAFRQACHHWLRHKYPGKVRSDAKAAEMLETALARRVTAT